MRIKLLENLTSSIEDKITENEDYKSLNKKIIELQIELKKELSESGLKIYKRLEELEAESEAFSVDFACNKAFLEGIALGQAVETNKASLY